MPREQRSHGKDDEEQRRERQRQIQLTAVVELKIPANVEHEGADKGERQQPTPRLARHHDDGSKIEERGVGKKLEFLIFSRSKKQRGDEGSYESKGREEFRILRDCERRGRSGYGQHRYESDTAGDQAVDVERRPKRKIHHAYAQRFERVRKDLIAAGAEAFTPDYDRNSGEQANGHASCGANPVVVEGILEEVGDANQDGRNTDAVQPM